MNDVNLLSGMRRMSLVLGAIGLMLGTLASYNELQVVIKHNKFEAFVTSEIVREEGRKYTSDVENERNKYLKTQDWYDSKIASLDMSTLSARLKNYDQRGRLALGSSVFVEETYKNMQKIERIHSELNKGGIKTIRWTNDYGVDSIDKSVPWPRHLDVITIDTQDGESSY